MTAAKKNVILLLRVLLHIFHYSHHIRWFAVAGTVLNAIDRSADTNCQPVPVVPFEFKDEWFALLKLCKQIA